MSDVIGSEDSSDGDILGDEVFMYVDPPPTHESGVEPVKSCLGDVLNDELVNVTECLVLYITEGGDYKSIVIGEISKRFNQQQSVTSLWREMKPVKTRQLKSAFNPKYRCLHCTYSTDYLYNVKGHHASVHPEHVKLRNDDKWQSHYSLLNKRNPPWNPGNSADLQTEMSVGKNKPRAKHKCMHCNYTSMYRKNFRDHFASEHSDFMVSTAGKEVKAAGAILSLGNDSAAKSRLGEADESLVTQRKTRDRDFHTTDLSPKTKKSKLNVSFRSEPQTTDSRVTSSTNESVSSTSAHSERVADERAEQLGQKRGDRLSLHCEICQQQFDHKRLKQIHMNACHRRKDSLHCPVCDADIQWTLWDKHQELHAVEAGTTPRVSCDICLKSFKSARNLRDHRDEVHAEGPTYECPLENCNKSFTRERSLRVHLEWHQGKKIHLCEFCGEGYSLKPSLLKHVKAKHPDERPSTLSCQLPPTQPKRQVDSLPAKPKFSTMEPVIEGQVSQYPYGQVTQQTGSNMTQYTVGRMTPQTGDHVSRQTGGQVTLQTGCQITPLTGGQVIQVTQQAISQVTPQTGGQVTLQTGGQVTPQTGGHMTAQTGDHMSLHISGQVTQQVIGQVTQPEGGQKASGKVEQQNTGHMTQQMAPELLLGAGSPVSLQASGLASHQSGAPRVVPSALKIRRQSLLKMYETKQGDQEQASPQGYSCSQCKGLYFANMEMLESHRLLYHPSDYRKLSRSQSSTVGESIPGLFGNSEVKLRSQFSNTPHSQLSEDLIEILYNSNRKEENENRELAAQQATEQSAPTNKERVDNS